MGPISAEYQHPEKLFPLSPEKDHLFMQPFSLIFVINSALHIQSELNRKIVNI